MDIKILRKCVEVTTSQSSWGGVGAGACGQCSMEESTQLRSQSSASKSQFAHLLVKA